VTKYDRLIVELQLTMASIDIDGLLCGDGLRRHHRRRCYVWEDRPPAWREPSTHNETNQSINNTHIS